MILALMASTSLGTSWKGEEEEEASLLEGAARWVVLFNASGIAVLKGVGDATTAVGFAALWLLV
jgi:hypothetical protein